MKEKASYVIPDFYQYYESNIEKDTVYDVGYTKYKAIVVDYFKYIINQVMEHSAEFKLPCRLGTLSIIKKLPKYYDKRSLRIDYKATKECNKLVFLLNEHSNYFKYRFYWNKQDSMITNKTWYRFVATRDNKRRLAQIIKNKEHDYIEID